MPYDDYGNPYQPVNTVTTPNRLDRKRGRFTVDYETNEINASLRGSQAVSGDSVDYYRFDRANSQVDDVYDEGFGAGRVFIGPVPIPVLQVEHLDGALQDTRGGGYYVDSLHVTVLFDTFTKSGITNADIEHQHYQRDRIVYDDKVFRIDHVQVMGQIQRRDLIVAIDCTQMRSDELVDDPQFAPWSA